MDLIFNLNLFYTNYTVFYENVIRRKFSIPLNKYIKVDGFEKKSYLYAHHLSGDQNFMARKYLNIHSEYRIPDSENFFVENLNHNFKLFCHA